MHILQVVHQFPPEHIGGTEFYTQWLSREMIKRGHHVSIFHRGSGPQAKLQCREEDGIRIWTAQNGPMTPNRRFLATFGNAVLTQAFTDVLEKEKPDLVHIQHLMGAATTHRRRNSSRRYPICGHLARLLLFLCQCSIDNQL